jgi:hypothetical protein
VHFFLMAILSIASQRNTVGARAFKQKKSLDWVNSRLWEPVYICIEVADEAFLEGPVQRLQQEARDTLIR